MINFSYHVKCENADTSLLSIYFHRNRKVSLRARVSVTKTTLSLPIRGDFRQKQSHEANLWKRTHTKCSTNIKLFTYLETALEYIVIEMRLSSS